MQTPALGRLTILDPCPVAASEMPETTRGAFCAKCQLEVVDLGKLTRREAERTLQQPDGKLCVRYQRALDGSVVTRDGRWRRAFTTLRFRWLVGLTLPLQGFGFAREAMAQIPRPLGGAPPMLANERPSSTPASRNGKVIVLSATAGATVSLDAAKPRQAPVTFEEVQPGEHVLTVVSKGYGPKTVQVLVKSGETSSVTVDLCALDAK